MTRGLQNRKNISNITFENHLFKCLQGIKSVNPLYQSEKSGGWVAKLSGINSKIIMIINKLTGNSFIKVGTHFYAIKNYELKIKSRINFEMRHIFLICVQKCRIYI